MIGYVGNIEKQTLKNNNFRQVMFTGKHCQLVVMCLQGGEEIGREIHPGTDQILSYRRRRSKIHFQRY